MKHALKLLLVGVIAFGFFTSCGPVKIEQFDEIAPNETAFLVPLEGANKDSQAKFMSVEYLDQNKASTKRVSLPLRKYKTGRLWFSYKWIPTMKVVKVNRQPVTREWTGKAETGTNTKNEALWVESLDSIGFGVGVNVTAMIKEEDAAKFLYYFAGKNLAYVVDENVRGKVNSVLSREFAAFDLEIARKKKNEVFNKAKEETVKDFAAMGVTITNLGLAEGLVYADAEIQTAINDKFKAEMDIQIEEQKKIAQIQINAKNVSIAKALADAKIEKANGEIAVQKAKANAANEFAKQIDARTKQVELEIRRMDAEARLTFAKNIKPGVLPSNIMPEGSGFLFGMDTKDK